MTSTPPDTTPDRPRRRRPTASTVVSCAALFVALGGTATAATMITGKQVKDGSLTSADVKNGSLPRGWRVATVTADNTDNANDTLVSILTNQTGTLSGCNQGDGERMRVRTWDVSDGALADRASLLVVQD